jgi:hypothetical protein
MEQAQAFDPAAVARAMQMAEAAAQSNNLVEDGLTALSPPPSQHPIAWVDSWGQVWPHEPGAPLHMHIEYLFNKEQVQAAIQASRGIIAVNTVPSYLVPQVTGEAPPPAQPVVNAVTARHAAMARMAMMQTFNNPAGAAVRVD